MFWDCETSHRHRPVGNEGISVVFSSADDRLLTFHGDVKEAELWDFNAGRPLCKLTVPGGDAVLRDLESDQRLTVRESSLSTFLPTYLRRNLFRVVAPRSVAAPPAGKSPANSQDGRILRYVSGRSGFSN